MRPVKGPRDRWLALLLALALARGVLYVFAVPPWQHPDEPGHFEHARLIAETRRLPGIHDVSIPVRRDIALSMLEFDFWTGMPQPALDDANIVAGPAIAIAALSQPKLYYIVAATWMSPGLLLSVEGQLYLVRLLGVLLGAVAIYLVWRGVRALVPEHRYLAVAVCGFLVFQPMYTDIMASANSDVLANALGAGFFVAAAALYRYGPRWRVLGAMAALLVAGVLTKTTFIVPALSLPVLLVLYPWPGRRMRRLAALVAAGGVVLAVAFVWLSVAGGGNPEITRLSGYLARYFRVDWVSTFRSFLSPGESGPPLDRTAAVVFKSFWASFGWGAVNMPPAVYLSLAAAVAVSLAGLARLMARAVRRGVAGAADRWQRHYLAYGFFAVALAWALAILRSQVVQGMSPYHSHGRYAFVAMAPFALLFAIGILWWLPRQARPYAAVGLVAAMAVLDAVCFWGYLVPYYHG